MSWRSIAEITEGTASATAAQTVVSRLDSQLTALETFLAETEEVAATDPNLAKMRADVEASYNDTVATLDQISREDLEGAGNFYAVGALSQISTALNLTIDIPDPKQGGGTVANFYRSAEVQNSEEALAIEDEAERAAYVQDRRERWADSEVLQSYLDVSPASNAFALATLDAARAQNDPTYTPNPERSFDGIAAMGEEAHKMMRVNLFGEAATDPIDIEANMLYRTIEAYRFSDVSDNPGELMSPEMQEDLQEINMNVMARALNGEYGDEIRITGEIENRNQPKNVEDIDPREAMRAFSNRTGTTFNPFNGIFARDVQGGIKSGFALPQDDHIGEFIMGDFRQEQGEYPDRLARISELVENADGQRIPIEDIYAAMDRDPAGPNLNEPTPRTMSRIEGDIGRIEERISMLEQLVADPQAQNIQDVLEEHDTSIESLMLGIKRDMERGGRYDAGLDADTYNRLYEEGNFDARMEALLGVPLEQSRNMTLDGSPLLQAMEQNFHTFHPPNPNAAEVPEMRDGTSQLGAALSERGGAVILDEHSQAEPLQFMYDSLPEIASHGSTIVLIENAGDFVPGGGLVDLSQTHDPIKRFYETGDPSHLDQHGNQILVRLSERQEITSLLDKQEAGLSEAEQERLSQLQTRYRTQDPEVTRLSPEEETRLAELQDRQELFKNMIVEGYEEHGIQFQFFGGRQEGDFSDEFGMAARIVTTNIGWDQKFENASEGYDNVIIFGGGAHFVEGVVPGFNVGQTGLDESLGYPTFSLSNPDGLLRGQGDYNLAPTEDGRWVPTGDPLAVENEPAVSEPSVTPSAPNVAPN